MFPKKKPKKDKELLKKFKNIPCLICGRRPSDPDHITTRGAGGGDEAKNVWPLCRRHHVERHTIGLKEMIRRYQKCEEWILINGRNEVLED